MTLQNGTFRTGFAAQVATKLQTLGYIVGATSNAPRRDYERTVIYDMTNGTKSAELARLKKLLNANVAIPLASEQTTSSNFLIILGDSSVGLIQ